MIFINGSFGEGGGQILRTALALSLVTGKPFRIDRIRANRKKPGLARQHLTAVRAAAQIGCAEVTGDESGSMSVSFHPQTVNPGAYRFSVGTAGSCALVLQTILPALLVTAGHYDLELEGGTHNPMAPSFDFLAQAFFPLLRRMGVEISARLERPGFYPAGGGKFCVSLTSSGTLARIDLLERGAITSRRATALLSKLPRRIADRELRVIQTALSLPQNSLHIEEVRDPAGPGNAVTITIESEHVTEVFTAYGERGARAETVAQRAVTEAREYLAADVPVGRHLADQLILPMTLAGGGSFYTMSPSLHTTTNIEVVKQFLDMRADMAAYNPQTWSIKLHGGRYGADRESNL